MLLKLVAIFSIICLVCAQEILTPTFLVQNGSPIKNLESYPIGTNTSTFLLNFTDPDYDAKVADITEKHIPVVIGADDSHIPFDLATYYSVLKTENFGRNIIVGDYIPTTMNVGHDFGNIQGFVIIANRQRNGRGSNSTKWDSPRGDVYMNINLALNDTSKKDLLPLHCGLALLSAVKSTALGDYSTLPIKLFKPTSMTRKPYRKVGGVLVEPVVINDADNFWYTSGCGLRVNGDVVNSISEMIDEHNAENPNSPIKQLELVSLIARTVNYLEEYYNLLQTDLDAFNRLVDENLADI